MNRIVIACCVLICADTAVARSERPLKVQAYCPLVVTVALHALGQFQQDGCAFVFDDAEKDGTIYAEAVGFDPMPPETITCRSPGWIVQVGQHPPKAPTRSVVLLDFGPKRNGSRTFDVRDERSGWRETGLVTVHDGCGGIEGVVSRHGGKWSAKTTRKND